MKMKLLLGVSVAAVVVLGTTAGLVRQGASHSPTAIGERKALFYQDSMHPWVKSDGPGKCTICGMDLTPIGAGQAGLGSSQNLVVLSPSQVTVLNVQTEKVTRRAVRRSLRVAGTLEVNETSKTVVSAPARGRIDALTVDYAGVEVERGQKLITMFSPELVQLRKTLLAVQQNTPQGGNNPVSQPQVNSGLYTGDILAPQSGVVLERNVYSGQYVTEGDRLLMIADASVLWFRFDVYQHQLPWFEPGQTIAVEVPGIPGKVFSAVISFIEPALSETSRSVKVRADVRNPLVEVKGQKRRLLKYGMYAEAQVQAETPEVLAVSRTAIVSPGGGAYAYVDKGGGAYEPRRLRVGRQGDECWEVLKGVEEGESVVTSGNLLIDAQAQFSRLAKPEEAGVEELAMAEPVLAVAHEEVMASRPVLTGRATEQEPPPPAPRMTENPQRQNPPAPAPRFRQQAGELRTQKMSALMSPGGEVQNVRRAAILQELAMKATKQKAAGADPLSGGQRELLQAFLAEAAGVSQALAADNLKNYNQQIAKLPALLPPLTNAVPAVSPVGPLLQRLASSEWQAAQDLAGARKQFLPFSTTVVELAKLLRAQDEAFATIKIYHCPMAPEPGLWIQTKGPLANAFYGSKMLRCGEEVTP
jgi:Cu(I)/Ag(I) efflux system membrane fusion protein